MSANCQTVVFTNKAYNAIIRESFDKHPVETGGILLGHILDNGTWIVMEVLPPGIQCIFEHAYFEYDDEFVNYLAQSVANQYKKPLDLLGLWHRHPASMDYFSSTDDGTNATFARQNPKGVISGIVNIDPQFRLTMYHMARPSGGIGYGRPNYEIIDVEVGDDIISEEFFELRYYDGEDSELHPSVQSSGNRLRYSVHSADGARQGNTQSEQSADAPNGTSLDIRGITRSQLENNTDTYYKNTRTKFIDDVIEVLQVLKKKWIATLVIVIALIACGYTIKLGYEIARSGAEWVKKYVNKDKEGLRITEKLTLINGDSVDLEEKWSFDFSQKDIKWKTTNTKIASVERGVVKALSKGEATISAMINDSVVAKFEIDVLSTTENYLPLKEGETGKIEISSDVEIEWESQNPTIFSIENGNTVVAKSTGVGVAKAKNVEQDLFYIIRVSSKDQN